MLSQVFVFATLTTLAMSVMVPVKENYAPEPYKFGYNVKDKHGEQYREETGDGQTGVKGSYGYVDEKGLKRQVNYVADKLGFRADVNTNEPGTANQNPAAVKMISTEPYLRGEYGMGLGYEDGDLGYGGLGYGNLGLGRGGYLGGYGGLEIGGYLEGYGGLGRGGYLGGYGGLGRGGYLGGYGGLGRGGYLGGYGDLGLGRDSYLGGYDGQWLGRDSYLGGYDGQWLGRDSYLGGYGYGDMGRY